jgi:tetratricopeptide (TPR) repeat protein
VALEEALAIRRELQDVYGEAQTLIVMGQVISVAGTVDAAVAALDRAHELGINVEDRSTQARASLVRGEILASVGRVDEARRAYDSAATLSKALKSAEKERLATLYDRLEGGAH